MMKIFKKRNFFFLTVMLPFLVGYRIVPGGNNWDISKTDPKIYLHFCQPILANSNDVESGDPFHGQTATHAAMVASLIADYNNVTTSFVRLADMETDGSFSDATHGKRVITICTGNAGNFDGYATQKWEGDKIVGCEITMGSMSDSATKLFRTLAHEIGHCLGLAHDQSTTHALMSYFSDSSTYRLQGDDKAGLTKLYPAVDYSQSSTFGASCAPQN